MGIGPNFNRTPILGCILFFGGVNGVHFKNNAPTKLFIHLSGGLPLLKFSYILWVFVEFLNAWEQRPCK